MNTATLPRAPSRRGMGWRHALRHLWFRSPDDVEPLINEVAVRIRAGMLLFIPLFMLYTLLDVVLGSRWEVTGNVINDTFDTDFDGRVIYMVEAVRRVYDYTPQSWLLVYAFFEMIVSMFPLTARLSPTVWIASLLAAGKTPLWKPLAPKRMAWSIGATMIAICWIFFNPDTFAGWVNTVTMHELLPTTENYMPRWIPLVAVGVCVGFMWMETVLGVCVGCELHALLARLGVFKQECEACNNLDFDTPR